MASPQRDRPHQAILPGNASGPVSAEASLNASEIRRLIEQHNSKQIVFNEDIFGPLQNDSLVIVIQVSSVVHYANTDSVLLFYCFTNVVGCHRSVGTFIACRTNEFDFEPLQSTFPIENNRQKSSSFGFSFNANPKKYCFFKDVRFLMHNNTHLLLD